MTDVVAWAEPRTARADPREPRKPPRARGSARKSCVAQLTRHWHGRPMGASRTRVVQRRIYRSVRSAVGRVSSTGSRSRSTGRPHDWPVCAAVRSRTPDRGAGASAAFRSVCSDASQISRDRETAAMSGTRRAPHTPASRAGRGNLRSPQRVAAIARCSITESDCSVFAPPRRGAPSEIRHNHDALRARTVRPARGDSYSDAGRAITGAQRFHGAPVAHRR